MKRIHFVLLSFLAASCLIVTCQAAETSPVDLNNAYQLYLSGRFADAEAAYGGLLKADPGSPGAAAGLIRSLLRQQKVEAALEVANQSGAATSKSAVLLSAMADLQYRMAQFPQAEVSYINAEKLDPGEFHAYLGLGRLYNTASLRRRAYDQLKHAYDVAPGNVEVRRAWMGEMTRRERVQALQAYLAGPHPDDERETSRLQRQLAFLLATADKPLHACKLQSKVEQTEARLEQMGDAKRTAGVGLMVKLNDHGSRLLLDTGASGILLSRRAAERFNLVSISQTAYEGIGDKGEQSGYKAVAEKLVIGDLEYHDCVVDVSDKGLYFGDGLIGADVFANYVVDLDMQGMKMKLSPLPRRPDEQATDTSLNITDDDADAESPVDTDSSKQGTSPDTKAENRLPKDRYVAPEMADWSKIFRIGHMLLIPTRVNDAPPDLFLIDTGAFSNLISERVARGASKVHAEDWVKLHGLSGNVNKVYAADQLVLQFGRYRQKNQEALTFDMSNLSRATGTEMGGILGFKTLGLLDIKIDYRDGLVDFTYDPRPFQRR